MGVRDLQADLKAKAKAGIPEDEPVFIIRAQDALSVPLIGRYEVLAKQLEKDEPSSEWYKELHEIMVQFMEWQGAHPSQVRVPN